MTDVELNYKYYIVIHGAIQLCANKAIGVRKQYLKQFKLVTVVEGDSKAPLSIVTTPRCKGES